AASVRYSWHFPSVCGGRSAANTARSVVALAPVRDLLLCAKDLFIAAMVDGSALRADGLTAIASMLRRLGKLWARNGGYRFTRSWARVPFHRCRIGSRLSEPRPPTSSGAAPGRAARLGIPPRGASEAS